MRGLYLHSREYRKVFLRDHFPHISQILRGNSLRCEYMSRLYSHAREYMIKFLANYLCIGFMPGGNYLQNYESKSKSKIRGEVSM